MKIRKQAFKAISFNCMVYQKILFSISIVILFAGLPLKGFSCECPEKLQSPEQANLIFKGKVIQVNTNWISGGWKFTFQVEQSWKRSCNPILIINTPWEKDCGYVFEEGEEYLVYVYKGFTMRTSVCMGNVPWDSGGTDLKALGPTFSPQAPDNLPLMTGLLSLLGFLAVSFFVAILVRARRRKF
ncbi:MAG: hypothetical protein AAF694_08135 [Bacteroidota bacterium]